jgi:anaerobic magnesium-protoporphyrin IX monomethyl ester cyclase
MRAPVALVFPPLWYYASVPADLLDTGSFLRARGLSVATFDLSAGFTADLLRETPGFAAFRARATYAEPAAYRAADTDVSRVLDDVSARHGVTLSFYRFQFPGLDEGNVPVAREVGLDPARNPALATMVAAVPRILAADPALIGIALVHSDQIVHAPVLARLLRRAGYRGVLCLYGAHEDVVAPEDFAEDLVGEPRHVLFEDFDAVVIGEAETALHQLWEAATGARARHAVAGVIAPAWGLGAYPKTTAEDLAALPPPDYELVDPTPYPFPEPVIDLRVSASCPWGRCAFCAITLHQQGYRERPIDAARRDLEDAHRRLGSTFFRLRDDLLTPAQLRQLAELLPSLSFRPRWSARARFEAGLDGDTLRAAAAAGLEELWLGLESASPRVRNLMVKGVAQRVVERILVDAAEAGIRVRALCMVGYPGETADEVRETFAFLCRHLFRISHISLTPFMLMRGTPIYRDPAAHGVTLIPDPVPRHHRIRFTAAATGPTLLSPAETHGFLLEATQVFEGFMADAVAGPTLSHAWMRASIRRHGWDAG